MKFTEITITIELDESKLTTDQQTHADMADTDLGMVDHPLDKGVDALTDAIAAMSPLSYFNYLRDGHEAVKVTF